MNENIELMMPIKAAPYDHQKKAFAFACDKFGVFDERLKSRGTALLMEMGTGKTIVSIAVAGCMYQYGKVLYALRQKLNLAKMLVDNYRKGKNPFKN